MNRIDLNCDMGELPEALADGTQAELMRYVSSVNIACGAHAGDDRIMRATIEQALHHKVSIGAHPGYEDRDNFGRTELQLTQEQIADSVYNQLSTLAGIAEQLGARVAHVKPHGALYNQAARHREVAHAIAEGVLRWRTDVILVGLAGSLMLEEFRAAGFVVAAEAFADRRYEIDGTLRSRKHPDALLTDPQLAAAQALQIAMQAQVATIDNATIPVHAQTICIHGDMPGAPAIAAYVLRTLAHAGCMVVSLEKQKQSP